MPRKYEPGPKSCLVKRKQKNGDEYVFKRIYHYDPVTQKVVTDKETLEYKIVNGKKTETRYKKQPQMSTNKVRTLKASRQRVGAMELLEYIGKKTGIDQNLLDVMGDGDALKVMSIARYWVATGGHTLPLIEEWQLLHKLPYEDVITEDIYHKLFNDIGLDYELVQNYFQKRIEWGDVELVVAYDSTTVSTYSQNQDNADYGFEKEKTGLPAIKVIWLYSISTGQPIAFSRIAGNIADVSTVINAIIQLQALGVRVAEVIMDSGYPSDDNAAAFFVNELDFIVKVHTDYKWVKAEIDRNYKKFGKANSYCDEKMKTSGICVQVEREYTYVFPADDPKSGQKKGAVINFQRKSYLLLFRDDDQKNEEDTAFRVELSKIRDKIRNEGMEALSNSEKKKATKYLTIPKNPAKYDSIRLKDTEIVRACKYNGIIALHASKEKDPASGLFKYRKRELIEESIQYCKDDCDGKRTRTPSDTVFNGRLFVQMVAMGYREGFQKELNRVKTKVNSSIAATGDKKLPENELKIYRKLKTWLHKKSVEQILYALDIKEEAIVSDKLKQHVIRSEYTAMQRLFVDLFMEEDTTEKEKENEKKTEEK